MSGGHFGYADSRAMDEIFGWFVEKPPNVFEDREISELIFDVFNLIHDFDWYKSGDTDEDDYLKAKTAFKKKWLKNSDVRVRRIIDETIDRAKKELYKTYGVKEEDNDG